MKIRTLVLLVGILVWFTSCKPHPPTDLSRENLIPKPVSAVATADVFEVTGETRVYIEGESTELQFIGQYLVNRLTPATGFDIEIVQGNGDEPSEGIALSLNKAEDAELGDEGYELNITDDLIRISANKPAGLFWAVQTIRQLLPAKIEMETQQEGPWEISTGTIRDYPTYPYRGSMLDVARHFFSVDDVKRYIDLMSLYKMNVFHLHLSDDQGWRIEIKSWPNLTTHGGSTEVGGGPGGYYTQEQYKDLVKYAQDRYVTLVPEIDMPGHTNAALASYPELNCNGKAPELYTGIKVGFSTLCTTSEVTYKFIDDVVRELSAITPGPYLHIGGDESHATPKEYYIPFVAKVRDIVKSHGKQVIGWEETAQIDMNEKRPEDGIRVDAAARADAASAIAQYWSNADHALEAVKNGSKLVMSPATKMYLDMQYDSTTKLGLHWAAYIEVDSSYIWNPATRVKGIGRENILGIEAPLWTETITNMDEIEYMVFPRIIGLAEIGWSPETGRGWEEYKVRLGNHGPRMKALGIDFYPSKQVPWVE